nr:MAG TPA: hypothetical protein [Bacteriophage sp.]
MARALLNKRGFFILTGKSVRARVTNRSVSEDE